jgi:peptide chain release factor subunit 1
MQAPAVTRERLRQLARERASDGAGLSLVFDLDPERFATPPARKSEVNAVLDEAHRQVEAEKGDHERLMRLRRKVEGAETALRDERLYDGCHGLAIFVGFDGGDDLSALQLPRPAGPDVSLDEIPLVRPLVGSEAGTAWAVVLVSRELGRILLGDRMRLEEGTRVEDDVHGRHDQGGLSQARFERSVEEEAREHFDRVAKELERLHVGGAFERLLIGGTDENGAALRERLPEPVAETVAGWFPIDVQGTGPDTVLVAARDRMEQAEREALEADMEKMQQQLGTGNGGAMGLAATLAAVTERRAAHLFAHSRLEDAGTRCGRCDRLSPAGERECPLDGSPLVQRERILDDAVRKALADSAEVTLFNNPADVPGGIAALTRY